jgi:CRISPR/Cas system CMR-associated protein Cmr5 small subunit
MTWHFAGVSEYLVWLKLAEEVEEEEQEVNTGINASSGDDHPSVVILNGLHLGVYAYLSMCR